jgi:hypothetical protein
MSFISAGFISSTGSRLEWCKGNEDDDETTGFTSSVYKVREM